MCFSPPSLHSGMFTSPHTGLRCLPHPHLLVPEEQLVACFIQLQPVDLAVVTDCANVVATNEIHLGQKGRKQCKYLKQ